MRRGGSMLTVGVLFAGVACGGGSPPRAEPRPGSAAPSASTADAGNELRRLEASFHGRIGAFALDTGTGKTVGYRARERFPGNSTFKAILCGAILSKARTDDPDLLSRTLRWTKKDVVAHSPITGRTEHVAAGITTARLCHAAITTSDNTAANVLLEQIGGPPGMTRYYRSLGDPVARLDRWEPELNDWRPGDNRDTVAPASMARNLHRLTLGTALSAPDRQRLIGWMRAATTGDERIRAGLPRDWIIGDKTGGGAYASGNDIAIARPPHGAPLIIAIYTHRDTPDGEIDDHVIAATASVLARALGKIR